MAFKQAPAVAERQGLERTDVDIGERQRPKVDGRVANPGTTLPCEA